MEETSVCVDEGVCVDLWGGGNRIICMQIMVHGASSCGSRWSQHCSRRSVYACPFVPIFVCRHTRMHCPIFGRLVVHISASVTLNHRILALDRRYVYMAHDHAPVFLAASRPSQRNS